MTANMIRGASLAVVSGTRLVYTRGYTLAEPGYPDIQPTTFFRQASVSKMFTAGAIYQLMDEGAKLPGTSTALTLDTLLQDALPNIANGTPDRKLEQDHDPASAGDDQRHYLRDPWNRCQRVRRRCR